ncbi:ABC-type multidrug transport system fused ATPase/permease subunit [Puniceicoccus vermicola]
MLCRGFPLDPPLTIRKADRVLVLDLGEIIECGNHRDLLSGKGHYADLYRRFTEE